MGLSLARALARRGRAVTLLTAERLGEGGASAVPAALLNPFRGRSGRAHPDDLAALATTWRWAEELAREGLEPGAHRTGVVRIADGARQARAFASVDGLRPFGPDASPAPFRAPHGGAVGPVGGWLEPRRWTAALAASARRAGADLRERHPVRAIAPDDDGWRVTANGAQPLLGRRLVLATGADPWPPAWRRALGPQPVFERFAGDVLVTSLQAPALPLAGAVYLAPAAAAGGFRAAVGGHHRPPSPPEPDTARRLTAALAWAWPPLAAVATAATAGDGAVSGDLEPSWWGVRAHAERNRPQLVALAPGAWWCGALAGRGFLAAAAWADATAAVVEAT